MIARIPITFQLSSGQRHESIFLESIMAQETVKRSGVGRPRLRPLRIVGDKGYTGPRLSNQPMYYCRANISLPIQDYQNFYQLCWLGKVCNTDCCPSEVIKGLLSPTTFFKLAFFKLAPLSFAPFKVAPCRLAEPRSVLVRYA